jgi:ABC-type sugar transport system permease subunit
MVDNQDTFRMGRVIDLPTVTGTSTPLEFQQLINQVQALARVMLATQGQYYTLPHQIVLAYYVTPLVLACQS